LTNIPSQTPRLTPVEHDVVWAGSGGGGAEKSHAFSALSSVICRLWICSSDCRQNCRPS